MTRSQWWLAVKAVGYGLLGYIPCMLGYDNVKAGGDFLPAFVGGLLFVTAPCLAVAWLWRAISRRRGAIKLST